MTDLCRLIFRTLVDLMRARATLEAEIWVLRQQINVLRRAAPRRQSFGIFDRLIFVGLYRLFPRRWGRASHGAIKAQQPRAGNRPMAAAKETAPARGCARAAIPRMPMGGGHPVFISQASPPPLVPSRVLGRPKFLHG